MKQKENCCPLIKIEDATPTRDSLTEDCSHSNPHYVYVVINGNTIDDVYTRKRDADDRRLELIRKQMESADTIDSRKLKSVVVQKFQISHRGKSTQQDAT